MTICYGIPKTPIHPPRKTAPILGILSLKVGKLTGDKSDFHMPFAEVFWSGFYGTLLLGH